jgi:hypothetical protein
MCMYFGKRNLQKRRARVNLFKNGSETVTLTEERNTFLPVLAMFCYNCLKCIKGIF